MLNGKGSGEVVALGFTAGFIGAAIVLLTGRLLYAAGIGPALGVTMPLSLAPPDVYRPLVWGGLWGIPLGFILRSLKSHHKLVGFLYFLAPVAALLLVFMPMSAKGFMVYAVIVNAPYGIGTTLVIAALCGRGGPSTEATRRASASDVNRSGPRQPAGVR